MVGQKGRDLTLLPASGAHTFDQLGYVACQEQSSGKLGAAPCHLWWWPPSAHCQTCAGRSTSPPAPRHVHPAPSPKRAKRDVTWKAPKHAKHGIIYNYLCVDRVQSLRLLGCTSSCNSILQFGTHVPVSPPSSIKNPPFLVHCPSWGPTPVHSLLRQVEPPGMHKSLLGTNHAASENQPCMQALLTRHSQIVNTHSSQHALLRLHNS